MGIGTSIAVFLTIWWTVLFAVLPLGNKTYAEMGEPVPGGGDPGAPMNPNLRRKFFTTTWVAALLFAVADGVAGDPLRPDRVAVASLGLLAPPVAAGYSKRLFDAEPPCACRASSCRC